MLLQAYAMTEASHQMTSNPLPKHGAHKPGSVGKAQGSTKVQFQQTDLSCQSEEACATSVIACMQWEAMRCHTASFPRAPATVGASTAPPSSPMPRQVAVLDNSNRELPVGEVGEVCIQGPNVTKGYLNRPEANIEAYAGAPGQSRMTGSL